MQNTIALSWQEALGTAAYHALRSMASFLPQLLVGLLVLLLGLVIGSWLKTLIKHTLLALKLSNLIKGQKLQSFMEKSNIHIKFEEVLSEVVRLVVVYVFIISALNIVGLTAVSDFLVSVLRYLPKVVSATFILALGVITAGFVESLVKGVVGNVDPATGRLAGKVASYTIVVFTLIIAIGELGIAERFINTLFIGFVATLSLSFGLAFGLGGKKLIENILEEWYRGLKRDTKKS